VGANRSIGSGAEGPVRRSEPAGRRAVERRGAVASPEPSHPPSQARGVAPRGRPPGDSQLEKNVSRRFTGVFRPFRAVLILFNQCVLFGHRAPRSILPVETCQPPLQVSHQEHVPCGIVTLHGDSGERTIPFVFNRFTPKLTGLLRAGPAFARERMSEGAAT